MMPQKDDIIDFKNKYAKYKQVTEENVAFFYQWPFINLVSAFLLVLGGGGFLSPSQATDQTDSNQSTMTSNSNAWEWGKFVLKLIPAVFGSVYAYFKYNEYHDRIENLASLMLSLKEISKDNRYNNQLDVAFLDQVSELMSESRILLKVKNEPYIQKPYALKSIVYGFITNVTDFFLKYGINGVKHGVRIDPMNLNIKPFDKGDILQLRRAEILNWLGHHYCQKSQPDKALKALTEAKKVCELVVGYEDNDAESIIWHKLRTKSSTVPFTVFYRDYNKNRKEDDLPTEIFKEIYLPELYIGTLYTLGRIYFYNKTQENKKACAQNLLLAKELCQEVYNATNVKLMHSMLLERNGLQYLALESKDPQIIKQAITKYEQDLFPIMERSVVYHEGGKQKIDSKKYDIYHELVCYGQLLKCATILRKLNDADSEMQAKGHMYASAIIDRLVQENNQGKRQVSHGRYYNDLGDFYSAYGQIDKAKEAYEASISIAGYKASYVLADAYYGLAIIYGEQNNIIESAKLAKECLRVSVQIFPSQDERLKMAETLANNFSIKYESLILARNNRSNADEENHNAEDDILPGTMSSEVTTMRMSNNNYKGCI